MIQSSKLRASSQHGRINCLCADMLPFKKLETQTSSGSWLVHWESVSARLLHGFAIAIMLT